MTDEATSQPAPLPNFGPTFGKVGLPRAPQSLRFAYVARPGLFRLMWINLFLGIITLGFYRFWAKTNVRKHIWSSVHINGEPLEYTGTGKELFLGFIIIFALLILPFVLIIAAIHLYDGPQSPWLFAVQVVYGLIYGLFWGFAVYRARRYQLSRTLWRGIRGDLVGSAVIYSLLTFGSGIAKSMSLGWATPVMNTVLSEQITNDMRFGNAAFKFKGLAGPLYPTYALCWFLNLGAWIAAIVTVTGLVGSSQGLKDLFAKPDSPGNVWIVLGILAAAIVLFILFGVLTQIVWAFYIAKEMRSFANYTRFDGAQFTMDVTSGSVIMLNVVNAALIIFTLGIAWPFVNQRLVRFLIDRLSLEGQVDIDRIRQSENAMLRRGEGLADAFDVGGL